MMKLMSNKQNMMNMMKQFKKMGGRICNVKNMKLLDGKSTSLAIQQELAEMVNDKVSKRF